MMHSQIKLILRVNPCATLQRKRSLGRKAWTALASRTRAERAPEWHEAASLCKFACRGYASHAAYGRAFAAARDEPEKFWDEAARDIQWFQPWSKTLHVEDPVFPNWWVVAFPPGEACGFSGEAVRIHSWKVRELEQNFVNF